MSVQVKDLNNKSIEISKNIKVLSDSLSKKEKEKKIIDREINSIFEKKKKYNIELGSLSDKLKEVKKQTSDLIKIEKERTKIVNSYEKAKSDLSKMRDTKIELNSVMSKLDLYSRIDEFTSVGHFETPNYLYNTSDRYAFEIKDIREKQKAMIKGGSAIIVPRESYLTGDSSIVDSIYKGQVKLMLSAFNIECDYLIGSVTPAKIERTLEQITNKASSIEKMPSTLECTFNLEYLELKLKECKLQYEYGLLKEEESIEQRLIKEQIREEQKVVREQEMQIAEAKKEEALYRKLLDSAQKKLSTSSDKERMVMEQKISILEDQLKEAEEKEKRALSMAQQTKKGHVYVISNIGSFGEKIYKIGLTRRLDPQDRIKELGNASVPFPFDVHAMIYSDDAPALEAELHRAFAAYRVNAVNLRKEFFNIDINRIKQKVESISGMNVEFKITSLATDYYESLRLKNGLSAA
ncbi:ATPase [Vibrio sp. UCD-FRSSP16_10]|nr:ATPase [Vibrio sp. UCD-FRSSP16_10]OBT18015.1 ATPase [Vibrio sp. UCD-FRSSP16_30]